MTPLCPTIPRTADNPRPVPFPTSFVVKKGSKMRACVAESIPVPVSTVSMTYGPAMTSGCLAAYAASKFTLAVSMLALPPLGMASRALTTRFNTTCSMRVRSERTPPSCGSSDIRILRPRPERATTSAETR